MAKCALCNKQVTSGHVVDNECLKKAKAINALRKDLLDEVSRFLQDNGFEDASKAIDCIYDL